jgi:hypothetical protein
LGTLIGNNSKFYCRFLTKINTCLLPTNPRILIDIKHIMP